MAHIDKIDSGLRRTLLMYAVIEHYRTWLFIDRMYLALLRSRHGQLSEYLTREIARSYAVGPRIASEKAGEIAKLINTEVANWPECLMDRAKICKELAVSASKMKFTSKGKPGRNQTDSWHPQASLMSKLIWFAKPDGWTMYDSHVCNALGGNGRGASQKMMDCFGTLNCRKFQTRAADIKRTLIKFGFGNLYGERVIDMFLWFVGATCKTRNKKISDNELFLESLSADCRDQLCTAARAVAKAHADNLLRSTKEAA